MENFFLERERVFKDEPNRVSSLFAVQHSLPGSAWTGTVRAHRKCAGRQNGARGAEQDEEAPPAEWNMTQPMLECPRRASPLRSTGGRRRQSTAAPSLPPNPNEPSLLVTGHRPLYSEVALMPPGRPRSTGCKGVGAGNARHCGRFQNLEETIVR